MPIEKSFKLASPWKAKGAYCTFSAEMSIKLKGSLELPSKGKMGTSTDIAPLGYSDGLVMRMGETWYSKDGAQICGMQTTIVETKLVGEAKVKDGIEFSFFPDPNARTLALRTGVQLVVPRLEDAQTGVAAGR